MKGNLNTGHLELDRLHQVLENHKSLVRSTIPF